MKFLVIYPERRSLEVVEHTSPNKLFSNLGSQDRADHGTLASGLAIITDEFGLLREPKYQHFFSIAGNLYANSSVIYAYDERGETISVTDRQAHVVSRATEFYNSPEEVEEAISTGKVRRPTTSINEIILWQWRHDQKDQTQALKDWANKI